MAKQQFYVKLHKRVLRDAWFRALPTDSHRLLFLMLIDYPEQNYCGIYEWLIDDLTLVVRDNPFVPAMLDQFESDGKIEREKGRLWVVNFTKYQEYDKQNHKVACVEAREIAKKLEIGKRWLEKYEDYNAYCEMIGRETPVKSGALGEFHPKSGALGENAKSDLLLDSNSLDSTGSPAAVAAAPHLQLAEKIEAIARRLASEHGYSLDLRRPEQLADGLVKSGLPLAELEETITWAADDPYYRGELCLQSKLLNGGMFRRMHNDRLTSLAKQQARGGTVYGQPPADVVYPSLEDALAQQKCPPPLPGEQAVLQ
jgi:hypothetical protein